MLDARGAAVPTIIHWGADLGDLDTDRLEELAEQSVPPVGPSSIDSPLRVTLVPLLADGWTGQPGLDGRHDTADALAHALRRPALTLASVEFTPLGVVHVHLHDLADGTATLAVLVELELTPQGALRSRTTVTNLGDTPFELMALATTLPLPATARERLDFSGRWAHERQAQRAPLQHGTWLRESRHGRGGHDDSFVTVAGAPGFGFRSGEVWAAHLAWSGDTRTWIDGTATGHTALGLGELLSPGEVRLAPGARHESPWTLGAWSDEGLDGISHRFHAWFRALDAHPSGPRPLTLNTWEAVYFDHDEGRLIALAEAAASVGVERFVLDDGWMTGRVDDSRALGDWTVDATKWPRGLAGIVSAVTDLGMQFGLWVEPEMVSLDSMLAREHPDWILRESTTRLPLPWRHQLTLDFGNPAVRTHVIDAIGSLLSDYDIGYLKWDMNRDLLGGSTHAHVIGLYEVIDAIRATHPEVEIESCSSGGARIDAGILERVQRVWPSDTNDPLERFIIERSTALLVPPEYLGSHVGAGTAHTTGRTHALSFRLAAALFGHAGIEWDVASLAPADHKALADWAACYRQFRGLLHSGTVVNGDSESHRFVRGVVSADRREALFTIAALGSSPASIPPPDLLPGLDPALEYRIEPVTLGGGPVLYGGTSPSWWSAGSARASGAVLGARGIVLPLLMPEQALVLHLTTVTGQYARR